MRQENQKTIFTTPSSRLLCLWLLLSVVSPLGSQAQDLIVTRSGDSLNVFITKNKAGYIYYLAVKDHSDRPINSVMPASNVQSITKDYFDRSAVPEKIRQAATYPTFRIGVQGGYSYRLAAIPDGAAPEEEAYYKKLKNGYVIGGDLTFFFNEMSGFGLEVNKHGSKGSALGVLEDLETGELTKIRIQEDISLLSITPYYAMRFLSRNRQNSGLLRMGVGYTGYHNNADIGFPMVLSAWSVGITFGFGYDVGITENLALGFGIALSTGYFEDYTVEYPDGTSEVIELESGQGEGLGRVDFTVGLRFSN